MLQLPKASLLRQIAIACLLFVSSATAAEKVKSSSGENMVFPADSGIINVKTVFGAKGDGVTDDTAAIQRAIDETKHFPDTLYFPDGTYPISAGVGMFNATAHSKDRFLTYQGQSQAGTIIRLKDRSPGFDDPAKPKVVFAVYQGHSTGDAMHGYVRNLTVDVGSGNPGAVGLRFLSNNSGAMYHVTIRSSDPTGAGKLGLDLTQSQIGPCLIKDVTVLGFDTGVALENSFSVVFEHLTLKGQQRLAFDNIIARVTIRDLRSENRVTAVRNGQHAQLTLIEANLTGGDQDQNAIVCEEAKVFLRDITQSGYGGLVKDVDGKVTTGKSVDEWYNGQGKSLFGAKPTTLRLPIKETPEIPWETNLDKWAKVEWSNAGDDITQKLQDAIDQAATSGKTTIYIPRKARSNDYPKITKRIRIHGAVTRILGMSNIIDIIDDGTMAKEAAFTFADMQAPAIVVERFFLLGGWKFPHTYPVFDNQGGKTVIMLSTCVRGRLKKPSTSGEWFLEDMPVNGLYLGKGEKCWARQYNPESWEDDMCVVDGGQLWILGLKTEGRAKTIVAKNGAKVELLGGVSYQSWKDQKLDPPMFTVIDSEASFTVGFYHYNEPYSTIVEEIIKGQRKTLPRDGLTNYHLPVYRSGGAGR